MDYDKHNQEVIERLKNKIGSDLSDKIKDTLVKMDIPAYMDPDRNIMNSISYKIEGDMLYVGSDLPYAPNIEWGRHPGSRPPFEPIHAWVIKKLGIKDPQARSIAFAICNKIEEKGIEPKFVFALSLHEFTH